MTHYKLKVSDILEVCDEIKCLQNRPSVRISCSNFKWHIDEKSTFSTIASLWTFTEPAVCEDHRYCLFTRVTWSPTGRCRTLWPTEGMCHYSAVSLQPPHLVRDYKCCMGWNWGTVNIQPNHIGILIPTIGTTNKNEFEIHWRTYWNIQILAYGEVTKYMYTGIIVFANQYNSSEIP